MEITAKELAGLLNAKLEGNPETRVSKLAKIEESDAESFCFLGNPKYFHYAQTAKAGILLCDETLEYNKSNISAVGKTIGQEGVTRVGSTRDSLLQYYTFHFGRRCYTSHRPYPLKTP